MTSYRRFWPNYDETQRVDVDDFGRGARPQFIVRRTGEPMKFRNSWAHELDGKLLTMPGETVFKIVMPEQFRAIEIHRFRVYGLTDEDKEIPTPDLRSLLWDVWVKVQLGDVFGQEWAPLIVLLEEWPEPGRLAPGWNTHVDLKTTRPVPGIDRLLFVIDYRWRL